MCSAIELAVYMFRDLTAVYIKTIKTGCFMFRDLTAVYIKTDCKLTVYVLQKLSIKTDCKLTVYVLQKLSIKTDCKLTVYVLQKLSIKTDCKLTDCLDVPRSNCHAICSLKRLTRGLRNRDFYTNRRRLLKFGLVE